MKIEIEEKELRWLENLEWANLKLIQEQRRLKSLLKENGIDMEDEKNGNGTKNK